ncbi:MAG: hypothetical protein ACOWWH_13495 [Eubacteriaceae bacterium]
MEKEIIKELFEKLKEDCEFIEDKAIREKITNVLFFNLIEI